MESSSLDAVILIWNSLECPTDQLVQEILRVLKAGGETLIRKPSQSAVGSIDKVIIMANVLEWIHILWVLVNILGLAWINLTGYFWISVTCLKWLLSIKIL